MTMIPYPTDIGSEPAGPNQSANNRAEQLIVNHVLQATIETLTDRHGTIHAFPWTPEQNVRVGVLGATFTGTGPVPAGSAAGGSTSPGTDDDEDETKPSPTAAPTTTPPVENRGVVGVDFVVTPDGDSIVVTIDLRYALYHPIWPEFGALQREAQQRMAAAASARTPRRNAPNVPMTLGWRRDERYVQTVLTLPVTTVEVTVSSDSLGSANPLTIDATAAVNNHFAQPDAAFKLSRNQTLPATDLLGSEADFVRARDARKDTSWVPAVPVPALTASALRLPDGTVTVSVSATNDLVLPMRDPTQDVSLYDARMAVRVEPASRLVRQRLGFANDDCRYNSIATVVGRGRGCVARPGTDDAMIIAETLPVHMQHKALSAEPAGVDISFTALAANGLSVLSSIGSEMRSFLRGWNAAGGTPGEQAQLQRLRDSFEAEVERFELGCDLLVNDPLLAQAFTLANQAFASAKGPAARWRLFQLVFIVTELGGLAVRESPTDPRLRTEIETVDVLWFPTGGGKTEAYLGLIAVALYYDRLRGKHRGTSAWLLFPLRMLSVQQLSRVSQIVHHAEQIRVLAGVLGDPFTLGYLVGAGNTPNRLARNSTNSWWPGLRAFAGWDAEERDKRRLVGACPSCGAATSIGLDADLADERLLHVCRACGFVLPIHASDDEVARYQPSVVVSTVDKITAFARNGQLTSFNRGPKASCPQHGWHSHKDCVVDGCTFSGVHTPATGFKDPTPALWIQDELHLVREDLGVFAAHYHTLMAELARGAGNLPSKVIAATATIEQFEDQLSQVYGRTPRMFPTGGPTVERSFYTYATDNVRRLYLGTLPSGGGTAKVDLAGKIARLVVELVHQLQDDPTPLADDLASRGITISTVDIQQRLFNYELSLAYVNSKAHGVNIVDDIQRLSEDLISRGSDKVQIEYLTGEVLLGELAATVAAIEKGTLATPRSERIRALVGTSVVSHGVDLDRLNFEILAGMPPTYAHYIQATARAGRTHVGLVISVFDRASRRETSMFQSFFTTHAALERMVEPVPVNRFAARAILRTMPGIACALLWDETRNPNYPTDQNIGITRNFRTWWNSHGAQLIPVMHDRIANAYRCPVPQPELGQEEQRLIAAVIQRWDTAEKPRMENWQSDYLQDLFSLPAMTSLRDVDKAVEFGAMPNSGAAIDRLGNA